MSKYRVFLSDTDNNSINSGLALRWPRIPLPGETLVIGPSRWVVKHLETDIETVPEQELDIENNRLVTIGTIEQHTYTLTLRPAETHATLVYVVQWCEIDGANNMAVYENETDAIAAQKNKLLELGADRVWCVNGVVVQ